MMCTSFSVEGADKSVWWAAMGDNWEHGNVSVSEAGRDCRILFARQNLIPGDLDLVCVAGQFKALGQELSIESGLVVVVVLGCAVQHYST